MRLWQQSVLKKGDLGDTSFAGSGSVQLSRVLCSCNQSNPQKQQSKKEKFAKSGTILLGKVIFLSEVFECTVKDRIVKEIYF